LAFGSIRWKGPIILLNKLKGHLFSKPSLLGEEPTSLGLTNQSTQSINQSINYVLINKGVIIYTQGKSLFIYYLQNNQLIIYLEIFNHNYKFGDDIYPTIIIYVHNFYLLTTYVIL
jgi:hypothetical protein